MSRHSWATVELRRFLIAISLSILASACAQLPKPELAAYTAAFEATRNAAEPLLADYAVAERNERLADMQKDKDRKFATNGFFNTFQVSDVEALSDASLPPGAAAIDRTYHAISRYNETLLALAENRNVDEARGQLNQVIDDLSAIAPPVGRMPVLKPAANLLVDFLKPAIVQDNREQFKRIVLDAKPSIQGLIDILRNYTTTQYDFTTFALQDQATAMSNGPERDKVVEKINDWHRTYANYVALLNALDRREDELVDAVRYPKTQSFLQRAAAGVEDLRNYTDALRLSLAKMHSKP